MKWFSTEAKLCRDCYFVHLKRDCPPSRHYAYECHHPRNFTKPKDLVTGSREPETRNSPNFMRHYTTAIFGLYTCGRQGRWFRRK